MDRPPHHQLAEAFNKLALASELVELASPERLPTAIANLTRMRSASLAQFNASRAALFAQLALLEAAEGAE